MSLLQLTWGLLWSSGAAQAPGPLDLGNSWNCEGYVDPAGGDGQSQALRSLQAFSGCADCATDSSDTWQTLGYLGEGASQSVGDRLMAPCSPAGLSACLLHDAAPKHAGAILDHTTLCCAGAGNSCKHANAGGANSEVLCLRSRSLGEEGAEKSGKVSRLFMLFCRPRLSEDHQLWPCSGTNAQLRMKYEGIRADSPVGEGILSLLATLLTTVAVGRERGRKGSHGEEFQIPSCSFTRCDLSSLWSGLSREWAEVERAVPEKTWRIMAAERKAIC